ncbi:MAG: hypothetical protein R6W83_08250 [Cryobacterium sp.]
MEDNQKQGPRRALTLESNPETIRLANENGRTVAGVASDLSLSEQMLHKGRGLLQANATFVYPGTGRLTPQVKEVCRLRRS